MQLPSLAALGNTGIKAGLFGWWAPVRPAGSPEPSTEDIHDIRLAMLEVLASTGASPTSRLAMRVRHCGSVSALWDLRSPLMQALAAARGEAQARLEIVRITGLFDGLVPAALTSRPAPLGRV